MTALLNTVVASDLVRMESSINMFSSSKWTKMEDPHHLQDDHIIKAIFVLQHDLVEIKALEKIFNDVSNPTSQNYGKWLEVRTTFHRLMNIILTYIYMLYYHIIL